jgi:hypothetical protein
MYEPSKAKTAVFGFRHTFFTLFIPPTIRLSMRSADIRHEPSAISHGLPPDSAAVYKCYFDTVADRSTSVQ